MTLKTLQTMKDLAVASSATFDGGEDDRLFYDMHGLINVFANDMSADEYKAMEKEMNAYSVKGKGFEVYVWNDVSGYKYWKAEGEANSSNYIMVTATITNVNAVDPAELKDAFERTYWHFHRRYDNTEQHDFARAEAN